MFCSCVSKSGERWWSCIFPGQSDHPSGPSSGNPWTHHGPVVPAGEFWFCQPHLHQNCATGWYFTYRPPFFSLHALTCMGQFNKEGMWTSTVVSRFKPCKNKVCGEDIEIIQAPKAVLWLREVSTRLMTPITTLSKHQTEDNDLLHMNSLTIIFHQYMTQLNPNTQN